MQAGARVEQGFRVYVRQGRFFALGDAHEEAFLQFQHKCRVLQYGYRFNANDGTMRLHRFIGTLDSQVEGVIGVRYHATGSRAGDSGTPYLDCRGNLVGIRIGVYTAAKEKPRAVMVTAPQVFNFMVKTKMVKGSKGSFVPGACPKPMLIEGEDFQYEGYQAHRKPSDLTGGSQESSATSSSRQQGDDFDDVNYEHHF